MEIKKYISKIGKELYELLFMTSICFISTSFLTFLPLWVSRKFNLDVFDKNTGNLINFGNGYLYFGIGFLFGIVGLYFLKKLKWLQKSALFIIIFSFPISMTISDFGFMGERYQLNHSLKRITILRRLYGDKIEPCEVLHIGDKLEKAISIYGKPAIESNDDDSFELPFEAPLFSIQFNSKNMRITDIECFDESKKAH